MLLLNYANFMPTLCQELHPVETKIIFESPIKESTFIEEDILEELNERQKKALEYTTIKKKITSKEYRVLNNVSKETAWKDINELLKKGLLIKRSSGAHTYYTFRPNDRPNDKRQKRQ